MRDPLAAEFARAPQLCARLLAQHVAGPDGRCAGCCSAVRLAPRWPCRIATLAQLATQPTAPRLVSSALVEPSSPT